MAELPEALTTPPPEVPHVLVSFPFEHVLLITLNRPAQLNAVLSYQHAALEALYDWYDNEPSLRCAVLTGAGRAFCAGADLKEWNDRHSASSSPSSPVSPPFTPISSISSSSSSSSSSSPQPRVPSPAVTTTKWWTAGGFGGLANRAGKKPVIAAVHGPCLGGGMEMAINADLVVASRSRSTRFGLPEATRGVVAVAGALPRLATTVGRQRATEMALLGRTDYSADEMREWGLVNVVVEDGDKDGGDRGEGRGRGRDLVVARALELARDVAANSPDSVIVSREGLRLGWEALGPVTATEMLARGLYGRINGGENMVEGVKSFVEKRKPLWKDSKL